MNRSEEGIWFMTRYVPILKGKQGELDALLKTRKSLKTSIAPLVEIPPIPPKYLAGEDDPIPSKSIDSHVEDTAANLVEALAGYTTVYIDGFYIEEEPDLEDGTEPSARIFQILRDAKVPFIPVVGLDRIDQYADSVRTAVKSDGRGCCLRINVEDLDQPPKTLKDLIAALLAEIGLHPDAVDLLVDYGPAVPSKSALLLQMNGLPDVKKWRTLTVASSSFPVDMSQVAQNSLAEFERKEWRAWTYLRSNLESVTRMPNYSDYGINHPAISEIDPRIMRLSPNIRYSASLNYVVAKGSAYPRKTDKTKKPNTKAADQYPKLAKMVISHPAWKTGKFSWGDEYIEKCSHKECVGNSTNWRSVGTCHHLAFVAHQLSSLHEPE
jgi:hypothetical protein